MKKALNDFLNLFFRPEELDKDEPEEMSRGMKIYAVVMLLVLIVLLVLLRIEDVSMM